MLFVCLGILLTVKKDNRTLFGQFYGYVQENCEDRAAAVSIGKTLKYGFDIPTSLKHIMQDSTSNNIVDYLE